VTSVLEVIGFATIPSRPARVVVATVEVSTSTVSVLCSASSLLESGESRLAVGRCSGSSKSVSDNFRFGFLGGVDGVLDDGGEDKELVDEVSAGGLLDSGFPFWARLRVFIWKTVDGSRGDRRRDILLGIRLVDIFPREFPGIMHAE
jgi:hypothetical protein